MKYIIGASRNQINIFPISIDAAIEQNNEVRIIDLFVDSLNFKEFGFKVDCIENGRPAYHPSDLLKLYIYGYINGIRSSRKLETECKRNIEVMWLLKQLTPDHNTISNFRRDNPEAIRKVFKATISIAKHFALIGKTLIAGDSTKLRAQNSKKNNYNQKKIDRHLEYIENKLNEYNTALSKEDCDKPDEIKKNIEKQIKRKEKYNKLQQQLQETNHEQISTSDTESRQMITRNNITEVAYNVQTTVDAENCLLIDYKVTNNNDSKAMGEMLVRASEIIETTDFTALYDKGYHTGSEFKKAYDLGVTTLVAIPDPASGAPDPKYNIANFMYNKEENTYTCPQGHTLKTNGTWNIKNRRKHQTINKAQQFKTKECKNCSVKTLCTKNKDGRILERSEYADYVNINRINIESNPKLYKRRQAIVEHPFGTIKRQWGFSYIITKKGMKRASADVGLIFTVYNLRRIINILGAEVFKKYLKVLVYFILTFVKLVSSKIRYFIFQNIITKFCDKHFPCSYNRIIFD
jgi:transposase